MPDHATDDPYQILGIARGSADAAIAAAYRALARRHHPDLAGEPATAAMMRINAAFDAIRTAERRAAHDARTGGTGTSGTGGPGGPGRTTRASHRPAPDPMRRRPANDGTGGAGPPPGRPSGSVLPFGRHLGWSIGEIARVDPGYLDWLSQRREGQPYLDEIDAVLRRGGYRTAPDPSTARAARPTRRRRAFGRG
jgi:curved DNA-binding protein CbpA